MTEFILFKAMVAVWNFILDAVFALMFSLVIFITSLFPEWSLPTLNQESAFFDYAGWIGYYVPVSYALNLLIAYMGLLVSVKVVRAILSIIQVDV